MNHCMSIKNKTTYVQCPYKQKCGDFCLRHAKAINIVRYDEFLKNQNTIIREENKVYDIKKINLIQQQFRKKYNEKISGPGYINPLLCTNNRDIISLENIWIESNNKKKLDLEFDKELLFTYKFKNHIFGYNILSLEQLFKKRKYKDPLTNKKFTSSTILKIKKKIEYCKKYNYNFTNINLSNEQLINNKIVNILKLLEKNNIYLQVEWLSKLNKRKLISLYLEYKNIINNYKQLYRTMYNNIINKNHFIYTNTTLFSFDELKIKNIIFDIILNILNNEKSDKYQKMTTYIILSGFCIVSPTINRAYPNISI